MCGETKPLDGYYLRTYICKTTGEKSQLPLSRCKACHCVATKSYARRNVSSVVAYRRLWAKINAERMRFLKKRWRKDNPEKSFIESRSWQYKRKATEGYNPTLRAVKAAVAETLDQYRIGALYLDVYTGNLIEMPTIDHITPLALGGSNDAENLCVTSVSNNSSKHNNLLIVWLAKRAKERQKT